MSEWRAVSEKDPNPYSVVIPSSKYTASSGELVLSNGHTVVLPSPEKGGIVSIVANGQVDVYTSAGYIETTVGGSLNNTSEQTFVSGGSDWYTVTDVSNLSFISKTLVYGSDDSKVYRRDLSNVRDLQTLSESGSAIANTGISSSYISYCTWFGETAYIFNRSDNSLNQTLTDATDTINAMDITDSYVAYCSEDNNVYVHDPSDGSLLQTLGQSTGGVKDVAISPDNNYIAYGSSDNNLYVHNTSDWSVATTISVSSDTAWAVDMSNEYVAYAQGIFDVYVYNTSDWSQEYHLTKESTRLEDISVTSNLISYGGYDNTVYQHDTSDGSFINSINSGDSIISISASGPYVAWGGGDNRAYLYDWKNNVNIDTFYDPGNSVSGVSLQ